MATRESIILAALAILTLLLVTMIGLASAWKINRRLTMAWRFRKRPSLAVVDIVKEWVTQSQVSTELASRLWLYLAHALVCDPHRMRLQDRFAIELCDKNMSPVLEDVEDLTTKLLAEQGRTVQDRDFDCIDSISDWLTLVTSGTAHGISF